MSNGGSEESWEQRVDFREESTPESSGWESVWVFGIQQINLLPSTVRSGGLYLSPSIVITHVLWYLRAHRAVRPRQTRTGPSAGPGHYPSRPPGGALLSGISPGRSIGPCPALTPFYPLCCCLLGWTFPLRLPLPAHLLPLHWLDFRCEPKEELHSGGQPVVRVPGWTGSLSDRREPRSPLERGPSPPPLHHPPSLRCAHRLPPGSSLYPEATPPQ